MKPVSLRVLKGLFKQSFQFFFSKEYLRSPKNEDIARLLAECKNHEFHALEMKKLPSFVAKYVFWSFSKTNYNFESSGFI